MPHPTQFSHKCIFQNYHESLAKKYQYIQTGRGLIELAVSTREYLKFEIQKYKLLKNCLPLQSGGNYIAIKSQGKKCKYSSTRLFLPYQFYGGVSKFLSKPGT